MSQIPDILKEIVEEEARKILNRDRYDTITLIERELDRRDRIEAKATSKSNGLNSPLVQLLIPSLLAVALGTGGYLLGGMISNESNQRFIEKLNETNETQITAIGSKYWEVLQKTIDQQTEHQKKLGEVSSLLRSLQNDSGDYSIDPERGGEVLISLRQFLEFSDTNCQQNYMVLKNPKTCEASPVLEKWAALESEVYNLLSRFSELELTHDTDISSLRRDLNARVAYDDKIFIRPGKADNLYLASIDGRKVDANGTKVEAELFITGSRSTADNKFFLEKSD